MTDLELCIMLAIVTDPCVVTMTELIRWAIRSANRIVRRARR